MVTCPTGKGVIVMRGTTFGTFKLSQSMVWTRLEQIMINYHWAPLAIPIPDKLVNEINE